MKLDQPGFLKWILNLIIYVFLKDGREHPHRAGCDDGSTAQSDGAQSQGMPDHKTLEEARKDSPVEP